MMLTQMLLVLVFSPTSWCSHQHHGVITISLLLVFSPTP
jgi:hypothetical protein